MRTFFIALFPIVAAFVPQTNIALTTTCRNESTQLNEAMNRRDVAAATLAGIIASTMVSVPKHTMAAEEQELVDKDVAVEMWKRDLDEKVDLNTARIVDYKQFQGMYPSIAGKIASKKPFSKVSDVYEIDGLSSQDRTVLKKYEKLFTVNPLGRDLKDQLNALSS